MQGSTCPTAASHMAHSRDYIRRVGALFSNAAGRGSLGTIKMIRVALILSSTGSLREPPPDEWFLFHDSLYRVILFLFVNDKLKFCPGSFYVFTLSRKIIQYVPDPIIGPSVGGIWISHSAHGVHASSRNAIPSLLFSSRCTDASTISHPPMGPLSGNSRSKSRKSTENANNLLVSPDLWSLHGRSHHAKPVLFSRRYVLNLHGDRTKKICQWINDGN